MSKDNKEVYIYGAVGEEGCEFVDFSKEKVQEWIDDEVAGEGNSPIAVPEDYYYIHEYTKQEYKEIRDV